MLQAEKFSVAAAREEVRLARREAWPDFSLTAFYEQEEGVETQRQAGGGISVPLPVFNRNARGIEGARQKLEAENREFHFEEKRILAEYRTLHAHYQAAQLQVRRYSPELLKNFEQGIIQAEKDFSKGLIPLLTFLELDEETARVVFQTLEAQAELADKFLALLAMTGEEEIVSKLEGQ